MSHLILACYQVKGTGWAEALRKTHAPCIHERAGQAV